MASEVVGSAKYKLQTRCAEPGIKIWDLERLEVVDELEGHEQPCYGVQFDAVALASSDGCGRLTRSCLRNAR